MNRITPQRSLVALIFTLVLVLGVVPAYAVSAPAVVHIDPVPSHALVGGVDLWGVGDLEARAAIASASVVPTLAPLYVTGDRHTMKFLANRAVYLNVDAMLAQAYSVVDTVTPFEIVPKYGIKSAEVWAWAGALAARINHNPTNAKRTVRLHTLVVSKEIWGHLVYKGETSTRIRKALRSEIASPGATPPVIRASIKSVRPTVTRANIGKAILVVLSHYTAKLYSGTTIEKTYKIAIGMPGYSTPTGKWKVTGKVKNPSWGNPGSPWASNMPAYIAPGPYNPLGTRAIYLSAPGIRFHGTAKWWSIGHRASHGCMRMRRADVEDFYPRVPVGITVWIVK